MFKNPFYLAAMPIFLGFILFQFHWGTILVPLSSQVTIFLLVFIFIMLFLGYIFSKIQRIKPSEIEIKTPRTDMSNLNIYLVLFLTLIEGAYFKGFPILGTISYSQFGIPTIHPLILTFNSYIFVSTCYLFSINGTRFNKKKYILQLIVLSIPYIIEVNRGMLIMTIIAGGIAYIMGSNLKITFKNWIKLIISSVIAIYLFGLSGNFRINIFSKGTEKFFNSQYILSLGGASTSNNFNLFEPFYWGYIYLTSSLANLNSTTTLLFIENHKNSLTKFFITQFFPDFLTKRIFPEALNMSQTRVNSQFTTGTVFNSAFYLYGWSGILLTLLYATIFPFILHLLLKDGEYRYYVIGFSFLCSMYLFLGFSSMFSFTGLSLPIFYAVIGSLWSRRKGNLF